MQRLVGFAATSVAAGEAAQQNPLQKCLDLLVGLQGDIVKAGEEQSLAFNEFRTYCGTATQQKSAEIKTSTSAKNKLEASIADARSSIGHSQEEIEDLSAEIASNEKRLEEAKQIRNREKSDFEASEKELMDAITMLNRAVEVLEKEMSKTVASPAFVQTKAETETMEQVLLGLMSVVDAASFIGDRDRQQLMAFVQGREDAEDSQPAPVVKPAYESQSGGIIGIMENTRDKAEAQLRKERKEEEMANHNFEMTKMALEDALKDGNKQLEEEKDEMASTTEEKATAEGKLTTTKTELAAAEKVLKELRHDCVSSAADHEATVAGRKEELGVLGEARKRIQDTMGGTSADDQVYGDNGGASFLQVAAKTSAKSAAKAAVVRRARHRSSANMKVKLLGAEVLALVNKVATEHGDQEVAVLGSKIKATLRFSATENPFKKVKKMIKEMVSKLEREAREEAQEKAYCDKELGVSTLKRSDLADEVEGLKGHIDKAASESIKLKDEVKNLQEDLANLAGLQQTMDKVRSDEHAAFLNDSDNLKKGLDGIRSANKILKDYYGSSDDGGAASFVQLKSEEGSSDEDLGDALNDDAVPSSDGSDSSDGLDGLDSSDSSDSSSSLLQQPSPPERGEASKEAGAGLIGLLEVIESDFAKNLAEVENEESNAQADYEAGTQTNKVTKTGKERDAQLKTKQFKGLDKAISDKEGDLDTTNAEFKAVNEYLVKLKDRCVPKKPKYEEVKAKMEAEIRGLGEALTILKDQSSFLQTRK